MTVAANPERLAALSIEDCAARLEAHPDFRVLRRFLPREEYSAFIGEGVGLYVDVETTGLDTERDEIIELAIVPFSYDEELGVICDVDGGVSWFEEPTRPIPEDVQALTGITPSMVQGQRINDAAVLELIEESDLVVAHNADFDRRMLERRFHGFAQKRWACSYRDVPWDWFGCTSQKLEHILAHTCREFFDAHRALDDARVGVHVLAASALDGRTAFARLLAAVASPTVRVWATGARYEVKDDLKARGYRWSDGTNGRAKAWYLDLPQSDVDDELRWLADQCLVYHPRLTTITALDRYSVRADR